MRGLSIISATLLAWSSAALAADEQPICADRPSKSTGPCTVPKGKWQIETGLIDWSRDKSDGQRTDTIIWGNTAIKYGVSGNADIELWVTPLETMSMRGGGAHEHHSSFGDVVLRVKYELTPDSAPVQRLKSAAVPLIMSLNNDQKEEIRTLARLMGLESLAAQF